MTGRQLAFDLPARPALGRADFYVSPANSVAVAELTGWRGWPARKLALIGPEGSGKTHLAHVWAAEAGARFVAPGERPDLPPESCVVGENIDRLAGDTAAEEALFHLHNEVLGHGGHLLLTGRTPPVQWAIRLPDLASRLQGTPLVRIAPPDDDLLAMVLGKHFSDRQLVVPRDVIRWLVPRMPRTFAAAQALVAAMDAEGLAEGRPVNRALAQRVLDRMCGEAP